jgi:DNA polymerase-3 subunit delta
MATKKDSSTFEGIMGNIKARVFSPIYILMGEESYFIDKICDALSQSVLPEEEREFNQFVVFGSDVNAAQVADLARELPMMSQYKVIIVKEAQNIKNTDELEKYLDHPSPQTVLVYCYKNGTIDKRKKLISKANSVGVVFESKKIKDSALPAFIESYMKARKITIEPNVVSVIAESIGSDLSRLASELNKLSLAIPENDRRVTAELVEQIIGVSKEYNPFELRNALIYRNADKANKIINYFDKNPKSGGAYVLVPTLFNYFQNLMLVWYAPNRNDDNAIAHYMGFKSTWQVRDYIAGMKTFSAMKTMQIISKLCEIDEKNKGLNSLNTTSGDLMKELIFFILH